MLRNLKTNTFWAVGLPDDQIESIKSVVDNFPDVRLLTFDTISSISLKEDNPPFLLLTSLDVEDEIRLTKNKNISLIAELPRALVLPQNYTLEQVSSALDADVAEVLRYPILEQRFRSVLMRALEAKLVHQDMRSMSREIFLERELLERKNAILSFIVNFVERISNSMDYETILQNAFECINTQIPMQSMHVAFWKEHLDEEREVVLYINATEEKIFHAWEDILVKELTQQIGKSKFKIKSSSLTLGKNVSTTLPNSNYISLPITTGKEKSGILFLVSQITSALGRDQVEALETTMRYLATVLKNAHLYEIVKQESIVDPLTGLYNRRLFEKYFDQEIAKFKRYNKPMSFLLIDIDHFKKINDTMGHDTGDLVLREIAQIIKTTFRSTDHCFRYGGEEFTVIMPELHHSDAFSIAERLRKKIEDYTFVINKKSFNVTVSMGLSNLNEEDFKTRDQLIQEADEFLYKAKNSGRNCIREKSMQQSNDLAANS